MGPNVNTVSFQLASEKKPIPLVEAHVNHQGPFTFAIDTGATITVLSPELARQLGLHSAEEERRDKGVGAGGEFKVSLIALESLSIGTVELKNISAAIMDLGAIKQAIEKLDGVIGYNFLSKFRVTIDYQEQTIRFDPYS